MFRNIGIDSLVPHAERKPERSGHSPRQANDRCAGPRTVRAQQRLRRRLASIRVLASRGGVRGRRGRAHPPPAG